MSANTCQVWDSDKFIEPLPIRSGCLATRLTGAAMLLDNRVILDAADLIEQETRYSPSSHKKHGCFLQGIQQPCGLAGDFSTQETEETIFHRGVGCGSGAHTNLHTDNTPTPAPPESSFNRAAPQTPSSAVSCVSCESNTQCQQGLAGCFHKKQACFPLFPVLLVSHLDDYAIQERAAILEYDGGMTRAEAEAAVGLR